MASERVIEHRTLADMYTISPPAPMRAPYFGRWPVVKIETEFGSHTIEFAWSTFDVWPELLSGCGFYQPREVENG